MWVNATCAVDVKALTYAFRSSMGEETEDRPMRGDDDRRERHDRDDGDDDDHDDDDDEDDEDHEDEDVKHYRNRSWSEREDRDEHRGEDAGRNTTEELVRAVNHTALHCRNLTVTNCTGKCAVSGNGTEAICAPNRTRVAVLVHEARHNRTVADEVGHMARWCKVQTPESCEVVLGRCYLNETECMVNKTAAEAHARNASGTRCLGLEEVECVSGCRWAGGTCVVNETAALHHEHRANRTHMCIRQGLSNACGATAACRLDSGLCVPAEAERVAVECASAGGNQTKCEELGRCGWTGAACVAPVGARGAGARDGVVAVQRESTDPCFAMAGLSETKCEALGTVGLNCRYSSTAERTGLSIVTGELEVGLANVPEDILESLAVDGHVAVADALGAVLQQEMTEAGWNISGQVEVSWTWELESRRLQGSTRSLEIEAEYSVSVRSPVTKEDFKRMDHSRTREGIQSALRTMEGMEEAEVVEMEMEAPEELEGEDEDHDDDDDHAFGGKAVVAACVAAVVVLVGAGVAARKYYAGKRAAKMTECQADPEACAPTDAKPDVQDTGADTGADTKPEAGTEPVDACDCSTASGSLPAVPEAVPMTQEV
mmetsp:Transcript_32754/g.78816  ORF Transcript_32754/g.78816 Transcript_32754/m.78816 type:complete len:602 (-) Transcript_32754:498-2303(-)